MHGRCRRRSRECPCAGKFAAIETAYKEAQHHGEVVKASRSTSRASETPKSWITMGFDQDLKQGMGADKAQTVKFLSEQRNVPADQPRN